MKSLKTNLRYFLENFFDALKYLAHLTELTAYEALGNLRFLTRIKLLPNSTIRLPYSLGRTIRGLPFDSCTITDPFAVFIQKCISNDVTDADADYLCSLYKSDANLTAADILGIPSNENLRKYPSWCVVLPWESINLEQMHNIHPKNFRINRSELSDSSISKNHKNFTFYSRENAYSQIIQTKKLWESINAIGVQPLKPLPSAIILIDGSSWRWFMTTSGNHRAYLSKIYGCSYLSVRVHSFVCKQDAWNWPNVRNGTFSPHEAIEVFESIFNGTKSIRGSV